MDVMLPSCLVIVPITHLLLPFLVVLCLLYFLCGSFILNWHGGGLGSVCVKWAICVSVYSHYVSVCSRLWVTQQPDLKRHNQVKRKRVAVSWIQCCGWMSKPDRVFSVLNASLLYILISFLPAKIPHLISTAVFVSIVQKC